MIPSNFAGEVEVGQLMYGMSMNGIYKGDDMRRVIDYLISSSDLAIRAKTRR